MSEPLLDLDAVKLARSALKDGKSLYSRPFSQQNTNTALPAFSFRQDMEVHRQKIDRLLLAGIIGEGFPTKIAFHRPETI